MARLWLQEQEAALRRELQTVAGTLHDSLKSSLPPTTAASPALAAVLPGLCLVDRPCAMPHGLIDRHAISATDPSRFQLRILGPRGEAIAATPGANGGPAGGERRLSTTIHLHRAHHSDQQTWGYLQISRSLAPLEAEARRLWWLGHGVFALAMGGMALASWWLAGLAMAPLVEGYRRQEQFSADVAHELRTPLTNLLALLEAERSGGERVLNQGRRLQQLIADLLLLASLERPADRNHRQLCNLAEISADVVEDFSEPAAAAGITLEATLEGQGATVLGVESELSRLLINLLSNAIQHSPAGSTVRVGLEEGGREIRLTVQDSGPGIPPAAQRRIFERFHRLDPARSRLKGGTGLGLAIAQAIARRHGGAISVQSAPGEGSLFRVQLPLQKRAKRAV